jgi:putative transposase
VTLQVKISACSSVTKTLQIFIAVDSQIHSHFNSERHLVSREIYKQRRSAALAGSRTIAA